MKTRNGVLVFRHHNRKILKASIERLTVQKFIYIYFMVKLLRQVSDLFFYHQFIKSGLIINFSGKWKHVAVSDDNFGSGENFHVSHNMATNNMSIFIWESSMKMSFICECSNKWDNLMSSFYFNYLVKTKSIAKIVIMFLYYNWLILQTQGKKILVWSRGME